MAKTNWSALQIEYIKSYAKTGLSVPEWCKKKGINYSTAKRYIKKPETAFAQMQNCEKNCETANSETAENSISYEQNCEINCEEQSETAKENSQISEKTAKEFAKRASQSAKMTKHGGYARYFKDKSAFDVVKDFSLGDEIELMRQRAVAAIETIEKLNEDLNRCATQEDRDSVLKAISASQNALDRAVARVESLSNTDNQIALIKETVALRRAQTKKTLIEADKLSQELGIKLKANQDMVVYNIEY